MNTPSTPTLFQGFPNSKTELYLYGMHEAIVSNGPVCQEHLHHRMIEMNIVIEGCQYVTVGSYKYEQKAGDLLIIPPMVLHQFNSTNHAKTQYFVVHLQISDPELSQMITLNEQFFFPDGHPLNQALSPLLNDIREMLQLTKNKMRVYSNCYAMLDQLELYYSVHVQNVSLPELNLSYQLAQEIENLLVPQNDYSTEASIHVNWLEQISSDLGISRRHANRIFQQTFGMSPRAYLSVIRQQQAMHLLMTSKDTIEEIAMRVGYENAQSFIRQFRKWTGETPGLFRKSKTSHAIYLTPLELK
jgi:AraC-like DNA-binding protein/mannose-6-phosphate isomerase-like protein (cupin superfamily)